MGRHRLIAALAASLVLPAAGCGDGGSPQETSAATDTAVVARINDGDTLTLRGGAKVRLVQVDAPELTTDCYGRAARRALAALVPEGTRVRLVRDPALDDTDRYGRLLRYVLVGDRDVNVELVRRGAASPYFFRGDRGEHAAELLDAVAAARGEHAGYWGACPGARLNTGLGSLTGKR
ncbi:MAG TPA: thermonuclease family protein [Gaiella sp.]|nr:thermonuclease family protein [Gaiella sp.]